MLSFDFLDVLHPFVSGLGRDVIGDVLCGRCDASDAVAVQFLRRNRVVMHHAFIGIEMGIWFSGCFHNADMRSGCEAPQQSLTRLLPGPRPSGHSRRTGIWSEWN